MRVFFLWLLLFDFILPASKGTSQLAFSWPCQGPRLRFTAPVSDAHMQFAPQGFETCFRLIGARDAIVVLDVGYPVR